MQIVPDPLSSYRRRQVPDRIVGDQVVAASPGLDSAVVLGGVAAIVWLQLDHWMTKADLTSALAFAYPSVSRPEREQLIEQAMVMLSDEGLLERRDR